MGNWLCCYETRSAVANMPRSDRSPLNSVVRNTQTQRTNVCDTMVPSIRESQRATLTNTASPGIIKPIGKSNQLQRNLQTKLLSSKGAKMVTVEKENIVPSSTSFSSNPQKVAHSIPNNRACKACGEIGHLTESCRYFTRLCFHCREEGHISRICPKRIRHGTKPKGNRKQQNRTHQAAAREQKHKHVQKKHGPKAQKYTKLVKTNGTGMRNLM